MLPAKVGAASVDRAEVDSAAAVVVTEAVFVLDVK
jgi:hypothetical protein